ncbi:major facilitator transporter [Methylocella silvestris BL2]|uniref:Major facilitator transporter n=1 Tax=Methylocella silvestris (strain DSM 15510 / CIP 108128 / LMG 27833 / NCIMB 13906 / BL2) TaxID=395965 RepID=B8EJ60_METSB|nr:hypothetical protein [Methylocella silvestris]ACK52552.1 major facilitator transporter [Methylocella silvestris BL2]
MTALRERRAGLLSCACDFDVPDESALDARAQPLALIAAGFAFSVLAQALAFAVLPIAGAVLAPRPEAATAPVALMLAGAATATFPAAFLTGLFGRRSAFALGASLGVAGAALAAFGLVAGEFAALCLGAFWLGVAQGFGLFYRHAVGGGARAAAIVLGSASLAAFAAPAVVGLSQAVAGPLAPAGALIGAALAQLGVLMLAAPLPATVELSPPDSAGDSAAADFARRFAAITSAAALAWFGMMALMAGAPLAMAGCGLGLGAASGGIAWHLLAMYAPAAAIAASGWRPPAAATTLAGLALLTIGILAARGQNSAVGFDLALIVGGCGWSLATLGATQWLHQRGAPRAMLALHDFILFAAAVAGALLGAVIV